MAVATLDRRFILSDVPETLSGMRHNPWRRLREVLPDWDVVQRPMVGAARGATDTLAQQITLDSRQLQRQMRCTLDHELMHAEAGDIGCQHPHREAQINQASARRLIPMSQLLEAVKWARTAGELAEELWVDLDTLRCRVDHLTPYERALIRDVIARRDNTEETA